MIREKVFNYYYLFAAALFSYNAYIYCPFVEKSPVPYTWTNTLFNMNWISPLYVFYGLTIIGFASSLKLFLKRDNPLFRVLVFLCLLLIIPLYFSSTGRLFHKYHTLLLSSFLCIFLTKEKEKNQFLIWTIQATILMTYVLSAFWKLSELAQLEQLSIGTIGHFIEMNLISNSLATSTPLTSVGQFLIQASDTTQFLFSMGLILFELSCIVPICKPRLSYIWGCLILIFHFGTHLGINISFFPSGFIAMLFLSYGTLWSSRKI